jgi:hypothetical protein
LKGRSKPVSKVAFSTTGSVPQLGIAATGASVAAGVAGAPHEESNMDIKTIMLANDHNTDFLFISLSPL